MTAPGCALDHGYITHPHADHFLGLPAVLATFPNAQPVALAESVPAMTEQVSPGYLQVWNGFFPGQLTDNPVVPEPLVGSTIVIGRATATLIPVGTTVGAGARCGSRTRARTIVAGHRNPRAADDDARRQLDECRRYLVDFDAALERSSAPAELVDR
jgi:phosphoribosyl 1,2-cyclic phosphodiesterase